MSLNAELNKLLGPNLVKQIKDLKQKFSSAPLAPPANPAQPPVDPVQLQEATLTDGTVIKYNTPTLAAGSEVTVVSPEGEMPAPEGELTLQDGTVIKVVNQDGKSIVESVVPGAGAPPAAPVQQDAAPDLNAKILEIAKLLNGFDAKFSAQEKENKELKDSITAANKETETLKANVAAFLKVFDEVLGTPTAAPIETPKNKVRPLDKYIAIPKNPK
jgi:hypothetical protein